MLKVLTAALLTGALLYLSNPHEVLAALSRSDRSLLAIALALVLVDRMLMAHRWYILLRADLGARLPSFGRVLHVFFVSTFLGNFLPTSVGGEAIRVYALSREGLDGSRVLATVLMDRVLGVISMLLMTLLGLLVARHLIKDPVIAVPLIVVSAASVLTAGLLYRRRGAAIGWAVLRRLTPRALRPRARRFLFAMHRHASNHATVTFVLAESVAVQLLRITQAFLVSLAVGISLPYMTFVALIPLALLVLLVPVSVGGLGTIQASFVLLFGRVGVSAADAFTVATILLFLSFLGNLPGGALYALGGTRAWRPGLGSDAGPSRPPQP